MITRLVLLGAFSLAVSAVVTAAAVILAGIPWPTSWTPDARAWAWAILLDFSAGLAGGLMLRRARAAHALKLLAAACTALARAIDR